MKRHPEYGVPMIGPVLLWSTPESVNDGRFTILAMIETFLATCVLIGLVAWTRSYYLILMPTLVAPLLLLRTEESTELGLKIYRGNYEPTYENDSESSDPGGSHRFVDIALIAVLVLTIPFVLGFPLVVRIVATTFCMATHPARGLKAIPRNWWKNAFAVDVLLIPEVMPGTMNLVAQHPRNYSQFVRSMKEFPTYTRFQNMFVLPLVCAVFFFPLLYRWSIKSTVLLYLPILWFLRPLAKPAQMFIQRLKLFAKNDIVNFVVVASLVTIIAFCLKLALWNFWEGFADVLESNQVGQVLAVYIQPEVLPPWQWAAFINSCIMIGIFLFVRKQLQMYEVGVEVNEGVAEGVLSWGLVVRRVLSFYTIACTVYLTAVEAVDFDLPPLGDKWFPWL